MANVSNTRDETLATKSACLHLKVKNNYMSVNNNPTT
jgi:hypothetical protein